MNGFRMSVKHGFVRARQLEGTFPGDGATGTWPITAERVSYGWGNPPEESWPYSSDWPPEEPPDIDLIAGKYRSYRPYRRVRTIEECETGRVPVGVTLEITDKWANPWRGQIPRASPSDIILPRMHTVLLVGFNPDREEFKFINSWGSSWGDDGYGYIGAQHLAATWSEGWRTVPLRPEMMPLDGSSSNLRTGALKQSDGSILHWFEIVGEGDERLGWASAIQGPTSFEIEELFVRPTHRGTGWGKKLFLAIERMAKDRGLPVKVWISFADTAPENLKLIEKIVGPSGLAIQASGMRWARLVAVPASDRTAGPVPTFPYPENPPSGPAELVRLARDVAVGLGTGVASAFLYDAFKSWIKPQSGKRITAKLGDLELSTSEVSVDEFRKLLKVLKNVKNESDIRMKILEMGIKVTIVELPRTNPSVDDQ
jgi:GNAT superfamily N-acetyltransferase